MKLLNTLRQWARRLKRDALTLWFACRHADTPWYAKALAGLVLAYAFSPIDLVPDFIPVLGYLDDALLLPLLIALAVRLLPATVLHSSRAQADAWFARKARLPRLLIGASLVVLLWLLAAAALGFWLLRLVSS